MEFSPKKASKKIMNSLITARDHARRYKAMDADKCYIGMENYLLFLGIAYLGILGILGFTYYFGNFGNYLLFWNFGNFYYFVELPIITYYFGMIQFNMFDIVIEIR
jgi:hypothetical protein